MPPHPCVFVNEQKLLDLKVILIQKHELKAEFVGGVLSCEDTVPIKRVCYDFSVSFIIRMNIFLFTIKSAKLLLKVFLGQTAIARFRGASI